MTINFTKENPMKVNFIKENLTILDKNFTMHKRPKISYEIPSKLWNSHKFQPNLKMRMSLSIWTIAW